MPPDAQAATIGTISRPVARDARRMATVLLLLAVYAAWGSLTYYASHLSWWLLAAVGGCIGCLHGSLQHEAVHGHLTGRGRWDGVLVMWPLSLWIPYERYRTLHQAHHECGGLTDPVEDPESFYWLPDRWRAAGAARRGMEVINRTLAGRLILGPLLVIPAFWREEAALIAAGDRGVLRAWLIHLAAAGAVLGWVVGVCGLSLWQYLLLFVWPSVSLALLRSFAEHRPEGSQDARTALVEGSFLTRLLFLNNNLHLVHHVHPELPWYLVRKTYLARRGEWIARNGGFHFPGYGDLARRYLFRPKDHPVHPGSGREA